MSLESKILPAFEKLYTEDVVRQDNNYPQRVGKNMNCQYEEAFVNGLTEFREPKVVNTLISNSIAVVEWRVDYMHKDYGEKTIHSRVCNVGKTAKL
ncbi:MAG: hypothetical protein ACOYLO_05310 [Ferruginibacter sp.]